MNFATVVALLVVAILVAAAVRHIYKAKKSGARCIGCSSCGGGCSCCSSGNSKDKK